MRAIALPKFGPPDVLQLTEVERPSPGPGQLLVRVEYSGTNPVDAKVRAAGTWAQIRLPAVIGYDASGLVEEVGPGCRDFKPGDEVFFTPEIFGNAHGTYAEYCLVEERITAAKPKNVSHPQAAAAPLAAGTAYEAIVRRLSLKPGESVLIHGAAGGVGSFAVQLAKLCGAKVFGTASEKNHALLRELGCDVPIDYRSEEFEKVVAKETGGAGVDAVFDCVGGDDIPRSVAVTRPFGRLATILGFKGDLGMLSMKNQTLHGIFLMRERERLVALANLMSRGLLRAHIAAELPLAEVAKAHERLDGGHGAGKIVLRVR